MVRSIAEKVYNAVMFDDASMLSPACYVDFGLDDDLTFIERFGALQQVVRKGATKEELDYALGSGAKLTELVQKYGSDVIFPKTAWDILKELENEDE